MAKVSKGPDKPDVYTDFINLQCNRKWKRTIVSDYPIRQAVKGKKHIRPGFKKYLKRRYTFLWKWSPHLKPTVDLIDSEDKLAYYIYSNLGVEDKKRGDTFYVYHRTYKPLPMSYKRAFKAKMHLIAVVHIKGTEQYHCAYKYHFINMKRYPWWNSEREGDKNVKLQRE